MTYSSFETLLSLPEWAAIMGIAPEFFAGFETSSRALGSQCSSVWFQYPWADSGDKLSREELAEAIHQAERMLADSSQGMGFFPAPRWITNEWRPYPRFAVKPLYGLTGKQQYGQFKSVQLRYGHVIAGGVRATTLISSGASVAYSKSTGNPGTYEDLATISVATTVTDECEIVVFFRTTDGAPAAADPRYQIRPLRMVISGGTATITGNRALFVRPAFAEHQDEAFTAKDDGSADTDHFAQTVDVYRVHNDTDGDDEQQGVFAWEAEPQHCPDPPCAVTTQLLCLGLRHRELGIVQPYPATWDATNAEYDATEFVEYREPDRVRLNYYAGAARESGGDACKMDREHARAVARLAAALLPKTKCGCSQAERQIEHWRLAVDLDVEPMSQTEIDNPFGRARGAVFAWRHVVRHRLGQGALVA